MDQRFPYEKRNWYPHMKPSDILIWERFITERPDAYESVQYDYFVGSPPPFDTTVNFATGGSDDALYRRKIDVVGHKDGGVDVIEVKPRAGPSAIGQVKGYAYLYKRDKKPDLPVRPVLITDAILPDMEELAAAEGVLLLVA